MKKIIIISLLIVSSLTIFAGTNGNEAWFFTSTIGSGGNFQLQNGVDIVDRSDSEITHSFVTADVGLYGLATYNLMFGLNINTSGDFNRFNEDEDLNLFHSLFAVSAVYFFSGDVGSGFYAKADLGPALLSKTDNELFSSKKNVTDWGLGFVIGGGFAIDMDVSSLLLEVEYSYRGIDNTSKNEFENANYDTNILGVSIGLMI